MILALSGFVITAALIIYCGARLSYYGDILAEKSGIGKAWFGLIMMAAVTSLPELVTGLSSVILIDAPDIAVGDVMGSCAFNLLIFAMLDFFVPGKPISSTITKSHIMAGLLFIILMSLVVVSMTYGNKIPLLGWFSTTSILLVIFYFLSIQIINMYDKKEQVLGKRPTQSKQQHTTLNEAIKRYIFFALIVVVAAMALPYFADHLARATGLSSSIMGTLFVAATTSLPELVVSIAAVRIGSMNIAAGNLMGSNIFNLFILGIDDLFYTKGPLLMAVNPNHALSGIMCIMMTSVVGIGIIYGSPSKRLWLGVDAMINILLYLILIAALFRLG